MIDWMLLPFRRYFDFSGRSRRREYWSFVLLNVLVVLFLYGLAFTGTGIGFWDGGMDMGMMQGGMMRGPSPLGWLALTALGAWGLATFIPNIAVTIRRLHDRDMSGWWYLGFIAVSVVPFVNLLAAIALFVIMLLPGTTGPNRFGPDPKETPDANLFG